MKTKYIFLSTLILVAVASVWASEPNELEKLRSENTELKQLCEKLRQNTVKLRTENEELKKQLAEYQVEKNSNDSSVQKSVRQYTISDIPLKFDLVERRMVGQLLYGKVYVRDIVPIPNNPGTFLITAFDEMVLEGREEQNYSNIKAQRKIVFELNDANAIKFSRNQKINILGKIVKITHGHPPKVVLTGAPALAGLTEIRLENVSASKVER